MIVKQLITELEKLNEEKEVWIYDQLTQERYGVESVSDDIENFIDINIIVS